jgi:branched-chain amino acid transport system ATP-binding protein
MSVAALSCEDVSLSFGGVRALTSIDFSLDVGEVVGLIGPNGAGKSSLINCLTGFYRPDAGRIHVGATDVIGMKPRSIALLGVSRTFQQAETLVGIGARDVMMLGRDRFLPPGFIRFAFPIPAVRRAERDSGERVEDIAETLGIVDYVHRNTAFESLPYGVRKLVDLGRALVCEPNVLLMDEPAAGLTDGEKELMLQVIHRIREKHSITQLLVDHDINFVTAAANRLLVLDAGAMIAHGPCDEVLAMQSVVDAYVGRSDDVEKAEA